MIKPMLAQHKIYEPHSSPKYLYEIKLQGERCLATVSKSSLELHTRQGREITINFPEIVINLQPGIDSVTLDGELCVLDENGIPQLGLIQSRAGLKDSHAILLASVDHPAIYFIFDVMEINYTNMMNYPLETRKKLIPTTFIQNKRVRELSWIVGRGKELFEVAVKIGHEGVMAKRLGSLYKNGRSDDWQKMKPIRKEVFYAVGLTKGKGHRASTFGALVLARTDYGKMQFVHVGTVGSGLAEEDLKYWNGLPASEKPLCKLKSKEDVIRWIDPYPVEVEYFEMSEKGLLIHPRLKGR